MLPYMLRFSFTRGQKPNLLLWSLKTRVQKPDADGIFENLKTDATLYVSVLLEPGPKVGRKLQKCHRLLIGFGSAAIEAYKAK